MSRSRLIIRPVIVCAFISALLFFAFGFNMFPMSVTRSLYFVASFCILLFILVRMSTTTGASHASSTCFTVSSALPHCLHLTDVMSCHFNLFWSTLSRARPKRSLALLLAVSGVSMCVYVGMFLCITGVTVYCCWSGCGCCSSVHSLYCCSHIISFNLFLSISGRESGRCLNSWKPAIRMMLFLICVNGWHQWVGGDRACERNIVLASLVESRRLDIHR